MVTFWMTSKEYTYVYRNVRMRTYVYSFLLELETYCMKGALNCRSRDHVTRQEEEDGR